MVESALQMVLQEWEGEAWAKEIDSGMAEYEQWAQTEARIVSKLRHLAPFMFMVPGAFHTLNRLQWRWGKLLLGIQDHVEARHALVIAQCGWDLSLGAQMAVEYDPCPNPATSSKPSLGCYDK